MSSSMGSRALENYRVSRASNKAKILSSIRERSAIEKCRLVRKANFGMTLAES